MVRLIIGASLLASLCIGTGCARRVVVQPAPPPRVEVVPVAPSPRHVWVKGHYVRRGRNYIWVDGHYALRGGGRY
jgi:hypothetical protein